MSEGDVPTPGGGTGDGTPDADQGDVASIQNDEDQWITLEVEDPAAPGEVLSEVTTGPVPEDAPPQARMPFGQVGFKVNDINDGDLVTVILFLPKTPAVNSYWKKNKDTDEWTRIPVVRSLVGDPPHDKQKLQEGGPFDTDDDPNTLTDPGIAAYTDDAEAIPALSDWGRWLLVVAVAWLGLGRLSRRVHRSS